MFDCYYCINTMWFKKIWRNSVNLYFLQLKTHGRGSYCIYLRLLPGEKNILTSFLGVHITDSHITFCDSPSILTIKTTKQVYSRLWIALLKHGSVSVKKWLSVVCCTSFSLNERTNGPVSPEIQFQVRNQSWPLYKKVKGQSRVIIWAILIVLECPMLYTKFQWYRPFGSEEEDF